MKHNEVYIAHDGTPVAAVDKVAQTDRMVAILADTYALRDAKTPDGLDGIADIILSTVHNYAAENLTFEDVRLALREGVSGGLSRELNPDTKPCAANFIRWIGAYVASPEMQNVRMRGQVGIDDMKKPDRLMTPDEIDRLNDASERESIARLWKEYQKEGKMDILLDGFADMVYRAIDRRTPIKWVAGTVESAEAQAVRELRASGIKGGNLVDKMQVYSTYGEKVQMRRNRILLCWYFEYLTRNNLQLNIS